MRLETTANRKPLAAGMTCEYRMLDVYTADVRETHRVLLLERTPSGTWLVKYLDGFMGGEVGAGWNDFELHPILA